MATFEFPNDYLNDNEPENMGGMDSLAFFAFSRNIVTFPSLVQDPQTDEEVVTLLGDFVFKPGEGFIQAYSTPGKTGFAAESQGETDCKSFHITGTLFQPTLNVDPMALARKINNGHGIIILTDYDGTVRYVIGDKNRPARFAASATGGKAAADIKGITITFEADSFCPGYQYNGIIPLKNDGPQPVYTITAEPVEVDFPASGPYTPQTITLSATMDGAPVKSVLASAPAWLQVTVNTEGTEASVVPKTDNTAVTQRSGTIIFKPEGSSKTATVAGVQAAAVVLNTYIGYSDTDTPSAADIAAADQVASNNTDLTWYFTCLDRHKWLAEPIEFDPFTAITNAQNYPEITAFTQTTITIDGHQYRLYISAYLVENDNYQDNFIK